MMVKQILASKPVTGVETITPDITIAEAAQILSSKRIGALVVSGDGKIMDGIVSERDIVRELARLGPACMSEKTGTIMTGTVIACTSDERADSVLQKMTEGRFRHMPVIDEGDMVGLISIGDVVKARLSELSMEKDALEGMIMGH